MVWIPCRKLQKTWPNSLNVINYLEDNFKRYDEYIAMMKTLGYNWGEDWLPHDGEHKDPKSGTSAKAILQGLGCNVHEPVMTRTGDEPRIKAARMLWPRVYIDNSARKVDSGFLGGLRLVDCLKRWARTIPRTTGEPGAPLHDQYSHACAAWGGMAEHVDEIRNDFSPPPLPPLLPEFRPTDAGMGCLG